MSVPTNVVRGGDLSKQAIDAATLSVLLKELRPSVVAAIGSAISRQFGALKICLDQQERRLSDTPDFPGKAAITQDMLVAQALCERIRSDLNRGADSLDLDIEISGVSGG